MPKKRGTKRARKPAVSRDTERLNAILIENFTGLQKAVTNLAEKFESLSDNIAKLLQLFEISARSFADKLATGAPEVEKDKEFLEKLNKLLEQNKVIAKGLTLMEERIRERIYGHPSPPQQFAPQKFSFPSQQPSSIQGEEYFPSSSGEKRTIEE